MPEVRLQTYWSDCDSAGIVYFGNFWRLCEQVEEELYLRAGKPRQSLLDAHSVWMPRVEAHVKFVRPIRNGAAIRVRMDPQFKGEKTVRFDFQMLDDQTGSELASGYMTVVCVDRANFRATALPAEIRQVLGGDVQSR
jgi:YbgC/YbaW family acyl-CoA thioester hydrolase